MSPIILGEDVVVMLAADSSRPASDPVSAAVGIARMPSGEGADAAWAGDSALAATVEPGGSSLRTGPVRANKTANDAIDVGHRREISFIAAPPNLRKQPYVHLYRHNRCKRNNDNNPQGCCFGVHGTDLCVGPFCRKGLCRLNLCEKPLCRKGLCRIDLCEKPLCRKGLCRLDLCEKPLCGKGLCRLNRCEKPPILRV